MGPLVVTAWRGNPTNAVYFVAGFYFAMVSLNLLIIILFGIAARFGNQVRKVMLGISVLALAGFGLYQLWRGLLA